MFLCDVILNVPLTTFFTYKSKVPLQKGQRVVVSFRRKKMVGLCWECRPYQKNIKNQRGEILKESQVKEILQVIDDAPFLNDHYLNWLIKGADYYHAPYGQAVSGALPEWILEADEKKRNKERKARAVRIPPWQVTKNISLTDEQNQILDALIKNRNQFFPALIFGVTGSGKTEIYIELIKNVLKDGRSALYLVPEIGLTPQTLGRLNAHFKDQLLVYHSGLTNNQRYLQWKACQSDKPQVLVGTRSALFAPFEKLGAIVIDEEHDTSYKQEDRFRYHARDLAMMRAQDLKIPIVLGSATPSLETYHLAMQKKYHYFELNKRVGVSSLPEIAVIDVGKEKNQTRSVLHLSQHIHRKIEQYVQAKEQVILFVGQRGFAQNAYCLECEDVESCPNCSVGLKFHTKKYVLKCHYCDFEKVFDEVCSDCKNKSLTLIGTGIQAIEDEIQSMHPGLRYERVDSDRFPSPQKLALVFERFQNHELDLILGTQMMTKGHDFAKVGFVGVAGIESQLGLPDFRASERAFQTLVQVAGRAGRQKKRGLVLVQSYTPQHMSLQKAVAQDFKSFADVELQKRRELFYPPFTRLVQIKIIANDDKKLLNYFKRSDHNFKTIRQGLMQKNIIFLGPVEMPIYKLRGWFRYHALLKIPKTIKAEQVIDYALNAFQKTAQKDVEFQVDVDPLSLF